MSHKVRIAALLAVLGAAVLLPASATPSHGPSIVKYKMVEWDIIPQNASKSHGPLPKVTFVVQNAGNLEHEFVVLKTNLPPAKLPVKRSKAVEKGFVGRVGPLKAGTSKTLGLTLKAGKYVLLCNLPGHYQAGQRTGFTVP